MIERNIRRPHDSVPGNDERVESAVSRLGGSESFTKTRDLELDIFTLVEGEEVVPRRAAIAGKRCVVTVTSHSHSASMISARKVRSSGGTQNGVSPMARRSTSPPESIVGIRTRSYFISAASSFPVGSGLGEMIATFLTPTVNSPASAVCGS
jgi:hypothetical protein